MNKLRVLLVAAALLTAACGTAASSAGSAGLRDTTSVGAVKASQGANADSESDVNRINPTITKGTRPAPVTPAQPPAATPKSPEPGLPLDRCNGGVWTDHEAGNRSSTGSVTHPPLPACAMQ
jgi:hypothetical protein